MGELIYGALTSLDGYIADTDGNFGWAEPKEDVHRFINALEARSTLNLVGKNMYRILSVWEDLPDLETMPDYIKEYAAAWKKSRKIVYSTTLESVDTADTTLRRNFDKEEILKLKREEAGNISIGGANLASQAADLGLVDEIYLFVFPICIGAGKKWIAGAKPLYLEKIETKEFLGGVTLLRYSCNHTR